MLSIWKNGRRSRRVVDSRQGGRDSIRGEMGLAGAIAPYRV